jgi:hypothetical protein
VEGAGAPAGAQLHTALVSAVCSLIASVVPVLSWDADIGCRVLLHAAICRAGQPGSCVQTCFVAASDLQDSGW